VGGGEGCAWRPLDSDHCDVGGQFGVESSPPPITRVSESKYQESTPTVKEALWAFVARDERGSATAHRGPRLKKGIRPCSWSKWCFAARGWGRSAVIVRSRMLPGRTNRTGRGVDA